MRVFQHLFPVLWLLREMIPMEVIFRNSIYCKGGIVTGMLVEIIDDYSMGLSTIPSSVREDGIFIQIGRDFDGLWRWRSYWTIFLGSFSDPFSDMFSIICRRCSF